MEYKIFLKDFASRTKANLDLIRAHVDGPPPAGYEVTQLVNSFLGLLILLDELPQQNFPKISLEQLGIKDLVVSTHRFGKPTSFLPQYVHRLRNAFAHRNVHFQSDQPDLFDVKLKNLDPTTGELVWESSLNINQISMLFNKFYEIILGIN